MSEEEKTEERKPNSSSEDIGKLQWTDETEELLSSWADVAACYRWLHDYSFRKFKNKDRCVSFPIIILSGILSGVSFSLQGYVPTDYLSYAQAGVGALNIFIGIMSTVQNVYEYAKQSESHHNVSVGWGKLHRNISIELSVDRKSRREADIFIKIMRNEYDRLLEQSPDIDEDVIEIFKEKFTLKNIKKREKLRETIKKEKDQLVRMGKIDEAEKYEILMEKQMEKDELVLPDICDNISHTKIYKEALSGVNPFDKRSPLDMAKKMTPSSILPEIKEALIKERFKNIEEKISPLNQFKLAMIGDRFNPLIKEIDDEKEHEAKQELVKIIDKEIEEKIEERIRKNSHSIPYKSNSNNNNNNNNNVFTRLHSVNYVAPQMSWTSRNSIIQKNPLFDEKEVEKQIDRYDEPTSDKHRNKIAKELEDINRQNRVSSLLSQFGGPIKRKITSFVNSPQSSPQQQDTNSPKMRKPSNVEIPLLNLNEVIIDEQKQESQKEDIPSNDHKTERKDEEKKINENNEDNGDNNGNSFKDEDNPV